MLIRIGQNPRRRHPRYDAPMPFPLDQVDAFTAVPFAGNPAAVVTLAKPLAPIEDAPTTRWMQAVAAEMNLSETAFVHPLAEAADTFLLRWFTPEAEVELCGHATLATAHTLWQRGWVNPEGAIHFHTRWAGPLTCRPADDGRIAMRLPIDRPESAAAPAGLVRALGLTAEPVAVARGRYDWLIELPDEAAVRAAAPDFAALAQFEGRGVTITAPAGGSGGEFVSRFFAPRLRVAEDPVTGSVHALLGPYWASRLGRARFEARQCSPRGGELGLAVEQDSVTLTGGAVTVFSGQLWAIPEGEGAGG